jgi:hypothetical protein
MFDWYAAKLNPKGLTFFSESFYPHAKNAEDVLVFVCSIESVSPNTRRILICNTLNGMIRQLAPYAAVGCFDVVRKASNSELEQLTKCVDKRKMDINLEPPRRKSYVRTPSPSVSDAV